jgi:hypothetical protein
MMMYGSSISSCVPLQPERSCSSVRRLDAVHRTDRAVSVTPGDGVGGTFRVWRRRSYLSALGQIEQFPPPGLGDRFPLG